MTKRIAFCFLIVLFALPFVMGAYLETRNIVWSPLRTDVTADDTALDGTTAGLTFQFDDKPAAAKKVGTELNGVEILFYGTDAADETCNFKVYAYRANGPAILVCTGVAVLGTALHSTGTYYADTLEITDYWSTCHVLDSGNNRIARLTFDLRGYQWVYVEIDIPAASQVASISAEISGY